jgi:hypothetical protein
MSGNWQFTLTRHNSTQVWTFSGFLLQSDKNVTGSFILNAAGCQGVGPVNGTFDGQNLQLTVGALGQDFSLSGAMASGTSASGTSATNTVISMTGQFTDPAGGCIGFSSTGTWTAVRVLPLSGSFHGSFVDSTNDVTVNVSGTLTQGTNVGASNATLSGTINATGTHSFCSYLTNSTIAGFISGTSATLIFYAPDGTIIGQLPLQSGTFATVSPDATSLTGFFTLYPIATIGSTTCHDLTGSATVTFP